MCNPVMNREKNSLETSDLYLCESLYHLKTKAFQSPTAQKKPLRHGIRIG